MLLFRFVSYLTKPLEILCCFFAITRHVHLLHGLDRAMREAGQQYRGADVFMLFHTMFLNGYTLFVFHCKAMKQQGAGKGDGERNGIKGGWVEANKKARYQYQAFVVWLGLVCFCDRYGHTG